MQILISVFKRHKRLTRNLSLHNYSHFSLNEPKYNYVLMNAINSKENTQVFNYAVPTTVASKQIELTNWLTQ